MSFSWNSSEQFESFLDDLADRLTTEASAKPFSSSKSFELRVREVAESVLGPDVVDFSPPAQAFPDVVLGDYGIEVKFSAKDTWRSVANSVLETNRAEDVRHVYLLFGKMGGKPEVQWNRYEECVMHVRTSHVPRFEVEINTERTPLFQQMATRYDDFMSLEMHEKMQLIRGYARGRLAEGERLWWLEDSPDDDHSLPIQARLYTSLTKQEKTQLRAEAVLLCPQIVDSGRSRTKYNDVVLYLLTYHGVLCHQARDLFSAGSVANPKNDDEGGIYIERAIKLIEDEIQEAAKRLDDALFREYWGRGVPVEDRIAEWLELADGYAGDHWKPSESLFLDMPA